VTALSRISAPISLRQQHHLVFISKFNKHMLYLPGLKNIVADFSSPPPPRSYLELLPPQRRQIQLTLKPWLLSETAAQKHSICSAVHLSNLPSDKQALNAWLVMFPWEFFIPSFQQNSEKTFFAFAQHFPSWEASLSAPCVF
jgi:hypothetical protein